MGSSQCIPLRRQTQLSKLPILQAEPEQESQKKFPACASCGSLLKLSSSSITCTACNRVNRISSGDASVLDISNSSVQLFRVSPHVFSTNPQSEEKSFDLEISNCSVCMESGGDCVLLNCGHGGFCEPCALRIQGKFGCCSTCREVIVSVLRLVEISRSTATAAELELVETSSPPVKVPRPSKKK